MERPIALVVDPDPAVRAAILAALALRNLRAQESADAKEAERLLADPTFDLIVFDAAAWDGGAPPALHRAIADATGPVVVALVDHGGEGGDWIRAGCFDVLSKPPSSAALDSVLERALRQSVLLGEWRKARDELRLRTGLHAVVGHSAPIEEIRGALRRLAGSRDPVCVTGEAGSGKQFVARVLHDLQARSDGAFVSVACAGIEASNWESKWQEDGPTSVLARAAGGTLYLEELPDLSPALQARLLETLGAVRRLPREREFRVVFSTRGAPERLVKEGRLRAEVLRELGDEIVRLPPLRERREDVAALARHFVGTIRELNRLPEIRLAPDTVELLERYPWPTNVQELRNAMEQAVILAQDGAIRPRDLPDRVREAGVHAGRSFREAKRGVVERFERAYLSELMDHHAGNVTAASLQAGMLRSALQRLLRKYGLKSAEFRRRDSTTGTEL